ncbi:MAG: hypoxanthine phosphoribosyltransferase, partial [Acidobacteria bacterium]|nr:hypoxanthine phosphoribosyltransferase [Acidobacteriota bacterium]
VEDIIDTGITLNDVAAMIQARHPRSVRIVSLLSKPSRRKVKVDVAHLGTEIDDVFVVGYGLDFAEEYRNLPQIYELIPEG